MQYIKDLIHYNVYTFGYIFMKTFYDAEEWCRQFFYTKIRRMSVVDYHLMMLGKSMKEEGAGEDLVKYTYIYVGAEEILKQVFKEEAARKLAVMFSSNAYCKTFAIDSGIVKAWRLLDNIQTPNDLVNMIVEMEYLSPESMKIIVRNSSPEELKKIDFKGFYDWVSNPQRVKLGDQT